jgi:hypothetical protein
MEDVLVRVDEAERADLAGAWPPSRSLPIGADDVDAGFSRTASTSNAVLLITAVGEEAVSHRVTLLP